jgi:NAD(P) transhydrogenase subunit alpha
MILGVLKEILSGERRVAISPETAKKYVAMGIEVVVQSGAGEGSHISDKDFKDAGAKIGSKDNVLQADAILKVQPPLDGELKGMKKGTFLISLLSPLENKEGIEKLASLGISAFSMELIPRISRAQSMDVLSSQSNLAGYRAVIDAVAEYGKAVPMMMTAAGTVKPAKALVLGAGVAGLQAIATAKRLGAIVSAFDVRPAVKEQVQSLGATFVEVKAEEAASAETKGGYAKEMSEDYQRRQRELIHETIRQQDIVVSTALIPGKPAPELITEAMVRDMKAGSVIVDLAVAAGGNCRLSERGKIVTKHGVKLIGYDNMPSRIAADASLLYARNLFNFLSLLYQKEKKKIELSMDDEIIKGCLVMLNGKIVHPLLGGKPPSTHSAKNKDGAPEAKDTRAPSPKKAVPKAIVEKNPHLKKKAKSAKPPMRKEK